MAYIAPAFRVGGPCVVKFGVAGAETTIGETKDGVRISMEDLLIPVNSDEGGDAPQDFIVVGKTAVVECLGMQLATLKETGFYRDLIGGYEAVGTLYSVGSGTVYGLAIEEQDFDDGVLDNEWVCPCVWPIYNPLTMRTSVELNVPLAFRVLPNAAGALFTAIPEYVTS